MALAIAYVLIGVHLAVWFGVLGRRYWRSVRAIQRLRGEGREARGEEKRAWPVVCAIVPARNEAAAIGRAMRSLLEQDYPALHVVCADDGSTDATPAILARLAEEFPARLTVLRVPDPPPGWMGKTHAQWRAVAHAPADAESFLFTDADVIHEPGTLRRAVAHMEAERADLFAIFPRVDCVGLWENATLPLLVQVGLAALDLRRLNDPAHRVAVGIGAFTLVRRAVYEGWGGHEAIRGEVVDDIALGMMTKRAGGRLCLARDADAVHLRMYRGLGDIVRGLEKNAHVAVGGGVLGMAAFAAAWTALHLLPLVAAGIAWWLPGLEAKFVFFIAGCIAIATGESVADRTRRFCRANVLATTLFYPLGVLAMLVVFARAAWSGAVRGEVRWRGRRLPRPPQKVRSVL